MADEVKMNKWWIQTIITLAMILVTVSIAWGTYSARVNALEKKIEQTKEQYVKDHDLLVSLDAKMSIMILTMNEIRLDLKKHLEK